MNHIRINISFLFLILFIPFQAFLIGCKKSKKILVFTELKAEESGIHFSNRITPNDSLNILSFQYLYNGGGVGLGDFNNDKKVDLFFTGNQVPNKLYLNIGDSLGVKFKDVSSESNIGGLGRWCTGASIIDINNDGLLDIYVSASNKKLASERANLLYINKGLNKSGTPIFVEMAQEYGIADTSHSTQSVFFDYDNDGDLDLYILVNEIADFENPNNFHSKIIDGSNRTTDKLYQNNYNTQKEHAVFTNVSTQEGILSEGYGLGVNITDINKDGWKDIYVTNDYLTNDLLYINQHKNGKHVGFLEKSNQCFKHTSKSAMGNEIEDINNDGLVDVLALDMMPAENYRRKTMSMVNNYQTYQNFDKYEYTYQYPRNTLQLNRGQNSETGLPVFSEIGYLAGVAETDWSWTPMLTDFDNDGLRDLIVTNGFPKDITNLDFIAFNKSQGKMESPSKLMDMIPSAKLKNFAFRNKGNLTFENVTESWGISNPTFSNGAAYADLDNDGDLDYVVNNINDSASVFINNSRQLLPDRSSYLSIKFVGESNNINGIGAIAELFYGNSEIQMYDATPYRGYLSTIEQLAHFGLGDKKLIEKIKITWPSGKVQYLTKIKTNQQIVVYEKNASIERHIDISRKENTYFRDVSRVLNIPYIHEEEDFIDFNIQKLLPHKFSQNGPCLAVGDLNGDKLEDVFIGGSKGHQGIFLIQTTNSKFKLANLLPKQSSQNKQIEDASALFFDFDKDGDSDLYIVSGGYESAVGSEFYQDRLYVNDGLGRFTLATSILPHFLKSGSCIKSSDFDKDGDLDLFIGANVIPGQYPKSASSFILRNNFPVKTFTNVTKSIAPILQNIGLVTDAIWSDFNNDNWPDLVITGEWMPITFLKNNKGVFTKVSKTNIDKYVGFWNNIVESDFDNDGDIDFIAGNLGQNTFQQISLLFPSRVFAGDFNNDTYYDAIPLSYFKNSNGEFKEFPIHSRDELISQFIQTRARFLSYKDYGNATINDILTREEQKKAIVLSANYVRTSYIENKGNGSFKIKALPILAQFSKILSAVPIDINKDGRMDVIVSGNDYGNEITTGRLDASYGLLLMGNGKGKFKEIPFQKSGIDLGGDTKALVIIRMANGKKMLISSENKAPLKFYELN